MEKGFGATFTAIFYIWGTYIDINGMQCDFQIGYGLSHFFAVFATYDNNTCITFSLKKVTKIRIVIQLNLTAGQDEHNYIMYLIMLWNNILFWNIASISLTLS